MQEKKAYLEDVMPFCKNLENALQWTELSPKLQSIKKSNYYYFILFANSISTDIHHCTFSVHPNPSLELVTTLCTTSLGVSLGYGCQISECPEVGHTLCVLHAAWATHCVMPSHPPHPTVHQVPPHCTVPVPRHPALCPLPHPPLHFARTPALGARSRN